jgi:putative mRNA 3-end processing factor
MTDDLLVLTDAGLYCPVGDFHIDPWRPVARAVITHAHADHARRGSGRYLIVREGATVCRTRLGTDAILDTLRHGEEVVFNGVRISLHPAGHILGSAQVRLEHQGRVWVVSGDYKLDPDLTCAPFEPLRCDVFITESTFGLPIYRWPDQAEVFADINGWWRANQGEGKASLLFGYALGKSQRLLSGLDPAIGPIYLHGALVELVQDYRAAGIRLPTCNYVGDAPKDVKWDRAIILAPPSAHGSAWTRKFGRTSTALASGWMQIRGTRRRKAVDRGFVLSDHADWPGLLQAIRATSAEQVWVTHGYVAVLVRYLRELGIDARAVQTRFEGEKLEGDNEEAGA